MQNALLPYKKDFWKSFFVREAGTGPKSVRIRFPFSLIRTISL